LLQLDTGALTAQEIRRLLNHLPVEISYVDKDDRVRFFSQTEERIFPRSPAVIGRQVQKCHPPASLHRVQRILDDFRAGHRDEAEFWIQAGPAEAGRRFVHIRYFAVRDEQGEYQGTLEVVQDVTHIRALEGERRLLDEGE
jgi:PAS domain S-box-containing protein